MRTVIFQTAIILTISSLLYFTQATSQQWLAYYHSGIADGEWWRLITAHFCHTNGYHFLLNAAGLTVISSLFLNTFKRVSLLGVILFSSLFISLFLFWFEPTVQWYVGLSGGLHALFSFGVCDEVKKKDKWGTILGLGLILKVGYEQVNGASMSTESLIEATVLVNAHLYGAIAGVVYFLCLQLKNKLLMKHIINKETE